ncbi:uncharacterized protein LOC135115608 [Scylla paramamosain]|uniref:uncharacterized protein LOC135115608 n=1 Tax=Scylla paramamosain TaxID=85552 RepID=UPI003083895F
MAGISYPVIPDPVPTPNDNAKALLGICAEEELLVVNNLQNMNSHYLNKKTYCKGSEWISELDICIVSKGLLSLIESFDVVRDNSLPSDHAPISVTLQPPSPCLETLKLRSFELGKHGAEINVIDIVKNRQSISKRPIRYQNINYELFVSKLNEIDLHTQCSDDIDVTASTITETLYECGSASKYPRCARVEEVTDGRGRWERMLDNNDQAKLWQAINWRGETTDDSNNTQSMPDDEVFKEHFEKIFNPPDILYPNANDLHSHLNIPILDDIINVEEVQRQIKRLKPGKACGPDGVPPTIFKVLPVQWIMFITTLFNNIFLTASYPTSWITAKLFSIYKHGSKALPSNYRAINVINTIAKLYDMVLSARLHQWFVPHREKAGSQPGRGCVEHLVTLRVLMDIARRKKLKLFITFVDFSRAYDCVPRFDLFMSLKRMGCGVTMLLALAAMYRCTNRVVGTAVIATTVGVRQGSPTSCILLILYVNEMIQMLKQRCPVDGFLAWLHVLVMMDDTILLSTTQDGMKSKIKILQEFCSTRGMIINDNKTKFMVLNGDKEDKENITSENNVISCCDHYIYLGSPFTDDGSPSTTSTIKLHANMKMCHTLKFISFINKNNDVPFIAKKKIFDAPLMSSLLYGCESWLNGVTKPIEKQYKWCIKQLLGVRKTTNNDVCMVELGMPPVYALVKANQRKFFKEM